MSKRKFSKKERRAYWIGVGISVASNKKSLEIFNSKDKKVRDSSWNGYNADNTHKVSNKFKS